MRCVIYTGLIWVATDLENLKESWIGSGWADFLFHFGVGFLGELISSFFSGEGFLRERELSEEREKMNA